MSPRGGLSVEWRVALAGLAALIVVIILTAAATAMAAASGWAGMREWGWMLLSVFFTMLIMMIAGPLGIDQKAISYERMMLRSVNTKPFPLNVVALAAAALTAVAVVIIYMFAGAAVSAIVGWATGAGEFNPMFGKALFPAFGGAWVLHLLGLVGVFDAMLNAAKKEESQAKTDSRA